MNKIKAFTLIELLVVISTMTLLMAILVPGMVAASGHSKQVVCSSNIRQLVLANTGYAGENNGSFVPAASDIFSNANKHRWHGVRDRKDKPFDATKGPLASYLADGQVKRCPQKVQFRRGDPWKFNYEDGCGGYGYNMTYIGSRIWASDYTEKTCQVTTKDFEVRRPTQTLMFADTAMARADRSGGTYYQEYSFAEPRYFVTAGKPDPTYDPSPSIHFRHQGRVNIGWADGHTSTKKMAKYDGLNYDDVKPADMMLGWFEPLDNTLFDLN